jgi:hypothetical protein
MALLQVISFIKSAARSECNVLKNEKGRVSPAEVSDITSSAMFIRHTDIFTLSLI